MFLGEVGRGTIDWILADLKSFFQCLTFFDTIADYSKKCGWCLLGVVGLETRNNRLHFRINRMIIQDPAQCTEHPKSQILWVKDG